ncbi:helix-turn-helix domain-containing protein [Halovivax limisalsi]|uniref:helix-turn-helix domain-containing protein n=1 Tax=Halovivax limisalsi TaxID=1453760 RepID=UPI001FFC6448|nr:helix-turn-helix domain-containing protein [Halovivax limisalsi]
MSLYQASFRIRHECPYRELSERHPDLTIREWYLHDCQVLELDAPGTPTDDLLAEIESMGTILHRSIDESGLHVVTRACLCSLESSIVERFEAHNCLYQPPTVHRQGWEHYSVIAFDEADVRALHRDLEADRDIDVRSKIELAEGTLPYSMLAPVDRLFDSLTDRQLAALRLALERGYYEQPRRTSLRDLAERTAVARSTFEEHLRKAENKVLTNAGEFLRLLTAPADANPLGVERTAADAPSASGADGD